MKEITSKQRAYLRSLAQKVEPIFQIGKNGLTPEVTEAVDLALEAREMVKISVLNNCLEDPHEMCQTLSERTHAIPVQVIGKKIVLYRPNPKKPKIVLPSTK
jgi:RNA-binding protein